MNPGLELDALIAEKVMGCKLQYGACACDHLPFQKRHCDLFGGHLGYFKPYSTSIAAAWEVVEKLRVEGTYLGVVGDNVAYQAIQYKINTPIYGSSAPHAICLAALRAVSGDV